MSARAHAIIAEKKAKGAPPKEGAKFDRRAAGLPVDPDWYEKLTFAGQPRPRTQVPCLSWIDPKWWERKWREKPDTFTAEGWANVLCTLFNKIDTRGRHG